MRQLVWTPRATVGMDAMCDSDEGRFAVAAACAVIEKKKMLDTAMVSLSASGQITMGWSQITDVRQQQKLVSWQNNYFVERM